MRKRFEDLTMNLGDQNLTSNYNTKLGKNLASHSTTISAANDAVVNYQDYEDHVVDLITRSYEVLEQGPLVRNYLTKINYLIKLDVPMTFRATLFRQLNSLVGTLMVSYLNDDHMYHKCFELMTTLKGLIDKKPQVHDDLNQLEWEELEKSIYLLSDWEEHLEFGEPVYLDDHIS